MRADDLPRGEIIDSPHIMRNAIMRVCLLLFCLIPASLAAQEQQVSIHSTSTEEEFSVPTDLQSEIRSAGDKVQISSLIASWLRSDGYLDASADSVQTTDDTIDIFVTTHQRYTLGELTVSFREQINLPGIDIFDPFRFTGRVFTENLIDEISESILSGYEQIGYYLAELRVESVDKNSGDASVQLDVKVFVGDRVRIQGVRFSGVERNSADYLRRVSGITTGEIFTPGLLTRGRQNLVNSGLFNDVSEGELVFVDDVPFALYELTEQQLNFFDGLIGYQPDPSGSASIVGYGDILLRNTIANGNLIDLRYEQLQPLVSKLNLSVEQQFLGGLPIHAGAGLHFTQQDSSYLVRNFSLNAGYRLFPGFQMNVNARAERSSVTNAGQPSNAIDSRANFYGVGFQLRNVNSYRVPTRGFESRVLLERGRRFINDERFQEETGRSFSQTILRSMVRGFIPIGGRKILAPMIHAMFLESPHYLITDLFRFGGAESLRGFREDQFRGSSVIWGELEGRYMLEQHSYLFLFGAYGLYERPRLLNEETESLALNESLMSLGFGLAFETQLGIIKFSYAVSPNENLSNGNVHVGISAGL